MRELIITNGDSAGDSLAQAFPDATVLPWRDVLHEGPVPLTSDPTDLSRVRATYLNDQWGVEAGADFGARDGLLADLSGFDRIDLWFEHDLYDQLQLLQVLDTFAAKPPDGEVVLVQADDYLGHYGPEEIGTWQVRAEPVTQCQIDTAVEAWRAFRQITPEDWVDLLDADLSALPHLQPAVQRMLEELPNAENGVSRTERHILEVVDAGHAKRGEVFRAYQECEDAQFMGDWSVFNRIDNLCAAHAPLLEQGDGLWFSPHRRDDDIRNYAQGTVSLTEFGRAVLMGEEDHASLNTINFWWGGTRVNNRNLWRWNDGQKKLVPPA